MIASCIYAIEVGDLRVMNHPYDADGKGCGVDYKEYPYIYFASPQPDVVYRIR